MQIPSQVPLSGIVSLLLPKENINLKTEINCSFEIIFALKSPEEISQLKKTVLGNLNKYLEVSNLIVLEQSSIFGLIGTTVSLCLERRSTVVPTQNIGIGLTWAIQFG